LTPPKVATADNNNIPNSTPNDISKIDLNEEMAKLSFITYASTHNKKPLYDSIITSITQKNAINVLKTFIFS
jgi:hypothetical protein